MVGSVAAYSTALGLGVFALEWLEYRYLARAFSTEFYVVLLAIGFTALGVWGGHKLTAKPAATASFQRNEAAIAALGLTARECEILELLSTGRSLKELGRDLALSPNTVKTHVSRVYEKLEVGRRVHAIEKARALALIA